MGERAEQRRLIILRHAKADRPGDTADVDRPLTQRGHADTGAAGAWLAARGYLPDLVICSPSKRTRQTWHGIAVALSEPALQRGRRAEQSADPGALVRYEPALYEEGVGAILALVRAIEPEYGNALVIGHNPTVSLLSAMLDPKANRDSDGLRTCGLAVHRAETAWREWGPGAAPLVASHTARMAE
ncbi:MAG TPA: histidine phosphatase family protein [Rugosimonospora sp.]|nr:histidine phosphatase family protein [Rugosimonospora sp.]